MRKKLKIAIAVIVIVAIIGVIVWALPNFSTTKITYLANVSAQNQNDCMLQYSLNVSPSPIFQTNLIQVTYTIENLKNPPFSGTTVLKVYNENQTCNNDIINLNNLISGRIQNGSIYIKAEQGGNWWASLAIQGNSSQNINLYSGYQLQDFGTLVQSKTTFFVYSQDTLAQEQIANTQSFNLLVVMIVVVIIVSLISGSFFYKYYYKKRNALKGYVVNRVKTERMYQFEILKFQTTQGTVLTVMTTFATIIISLMVASIAIILTPDVPQQLRQPFVSELPLFFILFVFVMIVIFVFASVIPKRKLEQINNEYVDTHACDYLYDETQNEESMNSPQ